MTGPFRTESGGSRIDRSRTITVTFDGVDYPAHPGDTLASALLAHGVRIVARGPYTGRPRGILSVGAAEPNAFVQVESGPGEPMVRATTLEAYDGLRAGSLSGKGRLIDRPDTSRYDKMYAHCDVLVVGAGRSGIAAAREAAADGSRVIIAESEPPHGPPPVEVGELPGLCGLPEFPGLPRLPEPTELPELTVLSRTTVTGYYDHRFLVAVERRTDHLGAAAPPDVARRRLWHIRAGRIVLATGTLERPIPFPGNDLPGIMLAGSAAAYVERYGVRPGRRAVVFGAHDGVARSAEALRAAGVEIVRVLDVRDGEAVADTEAGEDGVLRAIRVGHHGGGEERIACDLLAVSGGRSPDLHLYGQAGGRAVWSDDHGAFVPDGPARSAAIEVAGSARGVRGRAADHVPAGPDLDASRVFVDLQRDATLADVRRATGAGLTSGEHVKRYTTIGTAADQGRTSGVITARLLGENGVTTQRPPVEPIPFALLAGRDRGDLLAPARRTPMHGWHEAHGALWEDVGEWKRPWYYPRAGESMEEAVLRECRAARDGVAALDASTLGKIDVRGPDAAEFLDRIYTGTMSTLREGRCRYGVMCGVDGMVFDDGVAARLGPDRFHLTTTSGNAGPVLDWLEEWLQTEWPHLRVRCTSVTDQWAAIALVGPRAKPVLAALAPDLDVEGFRFMAFHEAGIAGVPGKVFRISYSGELSYEINVPAWHGLAVWEAVLAAGEPYGITPYGTETMHVLRAEKGFIVVGQDTDGTVTPGDAGLGWALAREGDWVGRRSMRRPDTSCPDRKRLVGLRPLDQGVVLAEGAQLVAGPEPGPPLGHVTSSYRGTVGSFALALVIGGMERAGETLHAVHGGRRIPAAVTDPVHYDKDGARRDGDD